MYNCKYTMTNYDSRASECGVKLLAGRHTAQIRAMGKGTCVDNATFLASADLYIKS